MNEENNKISNGLEKIRTYTRTGAFAVFILNLSALAWFTTEELQSMIVGALIGSLSTATILYFKKPED